MRWLAVVLVACGGGGRSVRTVEEVPVGTCVPVNKGESCERGARDYSAGLTVGSPQGHATDVAGTAWFRWPLFDVSLDERRMRKGDSDFHSLAGGIGTHLRPFAFYPKTQRYVDIVVNAGLELGGLYRTSHFEGRGDAFVGGYLDLFAPDVKPWWRYTETGVPGIRVGARYTWFVQGWDRDLTFEVGVIWRWGVPIDLYHRWTWQRGGD